MTHEYETVDGQMFLIISNGDAVHHRAPVADEAEGDEIIARYAEQGIVID